MDSFAQCVTKLKVMPKEPVTSFLPKDMLPTIARLQQLTSMELALAEPAVHKQSISSITQLRQLRHLTLNRYGNSGSGLSVLHWSALEHLTHVRLAGFQSSCLSQLCRLPRLQKLILSHIAGKEGLAYPTFLPCPPELREVALCSSLVSGSPRGLSCLSSVQRLTLKELRLAENHVNACANIYADVCTSLSQLSCMTYLCLSQSFGGLFGHTDARAAFGKLTQLHELHLEGLELRCSVSDETDGSMMSDPEEDDDISLFDILVAGAESAVVAESHLPFGPDTLHTLSLRDNNFRSIPHQISMFSNLTSLDLSNQAKLSVGSADLDILTGISSLMKLELCQSRWSMGSRSCLSGFAQEARQNPACKLEIHYDGPPSEAHAVY